MSTYQRPLQPWDPISPDQQIKPPIRYIRDNFQGTGQDSHTQPPAQDVSMWQALTNVQPITKGVIERRWGFVQLTAGISTAANRLVSFQRDSDGLRTILTQGSGQVHAYNENGTSYTNVFSPTATVVRSLTSRNYQYFFDGNSADLIKWNGDVNNGTSKWGIDVNNVTANQVGGGTSATTFGPDRPSTVTDLGGPHPWTNKNGLTSTGTASVSFSQTSSNTFSLNTDTLFTTGYNMTVPAGVIAGIQVTMDWQVSGSSYMGSNVTANLIKNGFGYGSGHYATLYNGPPVTNSGTFSGTVTLGSPTDLWGGTWSLADVNAANFGVEFSCNTTAAYVPNSAPPIGNGPFFTLNETMNISNLRITIFIQASGSSSTNSGSGIGITSIAGGGTVTLTIGRTYYLAFFNANTGHFSDLSPPSSNTGTTSNAIINLILATSNDPQVTHKYVLATADGGDPSILYQVAELVNGGGGDVTTYADNTPDTTLVLNQVFLFTDQSGNEFGISLNDPPPSGTLCAKHQGRLWMTGVPGATHSVFFSKAISDLTLPNGFIAGKYEEAWPKSNYFDISDGAESVTGLLSDGTTLYIGSKDHVRRLLGDDPTNFQFPQIVHPHVGVINQETWQIVFTQGSPAGAIWLTPDFRVIQSDFNTYVDIGAPIQDILNALQPSTASLAHATFAADGEYDLYILAVPFNQSSYCDLHLVYDMRHQKWFVWTPTDGSLALLNNVSTTGAPQWLFISGTENAVNQYISTALTDNGAAFSALAKTSWLGLGEPSHRKLLNELEVSADPAMTVTIQGALTAGDFLTPKLIVSNAASVLGPLGTLKFFIAAVGSDRYKYYQFIFQSSSTAVPIMLNSYNIEVIPMSDL